jgi:hypothetical protein
LKSTVYRLDPALTRASLSAGFALLALAITAAGAAAVAPLPVPAAWALAAAGALGVLGLFFVRLGRNPDRYAVEVTEHGIRSLGAQEWVPWSAVMGLRTRGFHQRVEILGPAGPTGAALEYQLERFSELLAQVLERCPFLQSVPERRFTRALVTGNAIPLAAAGGLAVFAAGTWQVEGSLNALLVLPVVGVALVAGALRQVSEVEIGASTLVVATPLRRREIPLAEIEEVEIGLRASSRQVVLGVWLTRPSGEEIDPLPPGADPFALYAALRRAVAAARPSRGRGRPPAGADRRSPRPPARPAQGAPASAR